MFAIFFYDETNHRIELRKLKKKKNPNCNSIYLWISLHVIWTFGMKLSLNLNMGSAVEEHETHISSTWHGTHVLIHFSIKIKILTF